MGGQELDSGALVHFSAASAHSMTICPRAQKSARSGFIHKGKKREGSAQPDVSTSTMFHGECPQSPMVGALSLSLPERERKGELIHLSSKDSPLCPAFHATCLASGVLSVEPLFTRE